MGTLQHYRNMTDVVVVSGRSRHIELLGTAVPLIYTIYTNMAFAQFHHQMAKVRPLKYYYLDSVASPLVRLERMVARGILCLVASSLTTLAAGLMIAEIYVETSEIFCIFYQRVTHVALGLIQLLVYLTIWVRQKKIMLHRKLNGFVTRWDGFVRHSFLLGIFGGFSCSMVAFARGNEMIPSVQNSACVVNRWRVKTSHSLPEDSIWMITVLMLSRLIFLLVNILYFFRMAFILVKRYKVHPLCLREPRVPFSETMLYSRAKKLCVAHLTMSGMEISGIVSTTMVTESPIIYLNLLYVFMSCLAYTLVVISYDDIKNRFLFITLTEENSQKPMGFEERVSSPGPPAHAQIQTVQESSVDAVAPPVISVQELQSE